jgi:hypothetical protein
MPRITTTKLVLTVSGPHGPIVLRDGACLSESDWSAAIKHRAVVDALTSGRLTVERDPEIVVTDPDDPRADLILSGREYREG